MQAVILAAGQSSRLWPLNKQHKSQIKIFGQPLVYWTIRGLSEKGIKDIVLIIGPNSSLKEDLAPAAQDLGLNLSYVIQEEPLGTGNAIFRAKDFIKEPFFIFWPYKINSGEIVEKILEKYQIGKPQLILVGAKTSTPWDYGVLKLEGERVIEISENPEPGKEPSDIKVLGAYFLQPDFFDCYQTITNHHQEDFPEALNLYMKDKETRFILWEKEVPALKYPWELLESLKMKLSLDEFKNYISSSAQIAKNVVIKGKVYIGDNVTIGENTVIKGPCFIGDNCKIGSNNILRGPVNLEKDIITAAFAEIKNCIIQEGTHFHSGYFGDSIIGQNCRFGAGFVTANRRIDRGNIKTVVRGKKIDTGLSYFGSVIGDNSCFGVQSSTMPGVLIGSDCLVGPGTFVFENIEDNTSFFTEFKGIKKKRI
jgi:bifunctional UDP-N-acetylglucosamine pyrophosphorylase/glucosamine-1-phosphate N-acetyltransferase